MDQDSKSRDFDEKVYAAAEQFILIKWRALLPSTRELLIQSGGYREGGFRIQRPELLPHMRHMYGGWIEREIGIMKLFLSSRLPLFLKRGESPPNPFDKRVLYEAVDTCVQSPLFADPVFLQLAFRCIAKAQADDIYIEAGYKKIAYRQSTAREGFINALCVIALPTLVGLGATEAFKGNGFTASACFMVGFLVLPKAARAIGLVRPWGQTAWQRHKLWSELDSGDLKLSGTSLLAKLHLMTKLGVSVPALAFDVAHLLQSQQTALAALRLPTKIDISHLTKLDDSTSASDANEIK
jgi:hypothetical protein